MRSRSLDQFYDYVGKREKEQSVAPPAGEGPPNSHVSDAAAAPEAEVVAPSLVTGNTPSSAPPRKGRKSKPKEYGPTLAAPPPGFRYVVRGGVTVAVPLGGGDADSGADGAESALAPPRGAVRVYDAPPDAGDDDGFITEAADDDETEGEAAHDDETEGEAAHEATAYPAPARAGNGDFGDGFAEGEIVALWRRLPRHIQLLVGLAEPEQGEEIAQKYYTRGFKESRQQLVERLLDPTLTLEETARVLGVVPTTVRRYTNRGVLPCYRTVGQQRRFRLSDVLSFLEQEQKRQARKAARLAEKLAAHHAAYGAGRDVSAVTPPYRNGAT